MSKKSASLFIPNVDGIVLKLQFLITSMHIKFLELTKTSISINSMFQKDNKLNN